MLQENEIGKQRESESVGIMMKSDWWFCQAESRKRPLTSMARYHLWLINIRLHRRLAFYEQFPDFVHTPIYHIGSLTVCHQINRLNAATAA